MHLENSQTTKMHTMCTGQPTILIDHLSAFKQNIVLLRHERTHTGEKVSCEECNKLFARHAILRKHKIVKHGHAARNAQQAQQIDPGAPQVQPPAPQADPHGQPPAPLG